MDMIRVDRIKRSNGKIFGLLIMMPLLAAVCGCTEYNSHPGNNEVNHSEFGQVPPAVIMIRYITDHSRSVSDKHIGNTIPEKEPGIILRVRADGSAIRSQNDLIGGGPYTAFQVSKDELRQFFAEMEAANVFDEDGIKMNIGPSASYTEVVLRDHGHRVCFMSWHEWAEDNPGLVATEHGIQPLDGRDRQQILAEQGQAYKAFRLKWDLIRAGARKLSSGGYQAAR